MPAILDIKNCTKRFGGLVAVKDLSMTLNAGDLFGLIGPNGAGKTTVFNLITGVYTPTQGAIELEGRAIHGKRPSEIAALGISRTFQNIRLFQSMTVLENVIEAPVHVQKRSRAEAVEQAEALLAKVGLYEKRRAYPAFMSGGQQQRASIARALCVDPAVMLFDEPTSALDPELVGEVLKVIRDLAEEGRTMLLVTHEMRFARDVSSHVMFLHQGQVEEEGPPEQIFGAPSSARVRDFTGALAA